LVKLANRFIVIDKKHRYVMPIGRILGGYHN
jgi:hypothetical protein